MFVNGACYLVAFIVVDGSEAWLLRGCVGGGLSDVSIRILFLELVSLCACVCVLFFVLFLPVSISFNY